MPRRKRDRRQNYGRAGTHPVPGRQGRAGEHVPRHPDGAGGGLLCSAGLDVDIVPTVGGKDTGPALAENRDTALRFLRATVEGNYLAAGDADAAKTVLAHELRVDDAANLVVTYKDFRTHTRLDAEVTREGAANVIATVNASEAGRDPDDSTLHEMLAAEGFFAAMKEKFGVG